MSIRGYLEAFALFVILCALFAFAVHERSAEKHKIEQAERQAYAKAQADAERKVQASQKDAENAQGKLDDYLRNYPLDGIVCNTNRYVLPTRPAAPGRPADPGSRPAVVPSVSERDRIIVLSAAELAIDEAQFQKINTQ